MAARSLSSPNAKVSDCRHAIIATGSLYDDFLRDEKALAFRVGHKVGVFQRGSIAARNAGHTALGPDGQTSLAVQNGAPMQPRYEAKFSRPTFTRGTVVNFDLGTPIVGGAGFCATGAVGFVVSGGSTTVTHTATFVMIEDVYTQIPLPIPVAGQSGNVVTPDIYFSSDCSVVIMVGADDQTQHAFRAEIYDLDRQRSLCTVVYDVSAPPPAGDRVATGRQ
jgi:hypothetical protein